MCASLSHMHTRKLEALLRRRMHSFAFASTVSCVCVLCAPLVYPYVGVVLSFYHLSHILNFNNFFRIGETRMPLECRKFSESNNDKKMPEPGAETKLTLSKTSRPARLAAAKESRNANSTTHSKTQNIDRPKCIRSFYR